MKSFLFKTIIVIISLIYFFITISSSTFPGKVINSQIVFDEKYNNYKIIAIVQLLKSNHTFDPITDQPVQIFYDEQYYVNRNCVSSKCEEILNKYYKANDELKQFTIYTKTPFNKEDPLILHVDDPSGKIVFRTKLITSSIFVFLFILTILVLSSKYIEKFLRAIRFYG